MSSRVLLILFIFFLILLAGVVTDDYSKAAEPRSKAQLEVKVVSNPRTPVPPPGQRKKLVFKEELSIGQRDADGTAFFFDAFDASGRCVTRTPLKQVRRVPLVWKGDRLYTIEEDENGFPVVKRHKITWKD
jgi:hypothetical protein